MPRPETGHGGPAARAALRRGVIRILIAANLLLGLNYLVWRYLDSINWAAWPVALALLAAETYSYVGAFLFGAVMWRLRPRGEPPPPLPDATVDVFITCYNEPVELVRATVRAAVAIRYPHRTYVLDDGESPAVRAMAEEEGVGYIVRSEDWRGRPRHAKAGNLNNALMQTQGEFILLLDADQIPSPEILDRTLGYFRDPKVAFVQTPQWFYNVPPHDPLGCQAPLFYGPIQQAKDGWNAAFLCGSNAVLRREALIQLGIVRYAQELTERVHRALRTADTVLRAAERQLPPAERTPLRTTLRELHALVRQARAALGAGRTIQEVTWEFQRQVEALSLPLVREQLVQLQTELAQLPGLGSAEPRLADHLDDPATLRALARREWSPLAAIAAVRELLLAVDVDRADEAQPVMPMATISVTEDLATSQRLHALGWRSVYHHEVLARGLAPEDLRSALQQRLRWAQGTIQVLLRENPLFVQGLSWGQRLAYFYTMWEYLSGFATLIYLAAPPLYLFFSWAPVRAYSADFFGHLVPYLAVNQLLFLVVGWGLPIWRGQQYYVALFPIWIQGVFSAAANVYFGRSLSFVVTPKTRQQVRGQLVLVWPQLLFVGLLALGILYGLGRLVLGWGDWVPVVVNIGWASYELLMLSVIFQALTYQPAADRPAVPTMPGSSTLSRPLQAEPH
jgi:cellulose synthase (UDP-forming)